MHFYALKNILNNYINLVIYAPSRNGPEDHVDLANKLQASVKLSQKVKNIFLNSSIDIDSN
jgi:hypothetical protein